MLRITEKEVFRLVEEGLISKEELRIILDSSLEISEVLPDNDKVSQ